MKFTGIDTDIIGSDYRRIVSLVFFNFSKKFDHIEIGDRIAQIVLERIATPVIEDLYEFDRLNKVEKGSGGSFLLQQIFYDKIRTK